MATGLSESKLWIQIDRKLHPARMEGLVNTYFYYLSVDNLSEYDWFVIYCLCVSSDRWFSLCIFFIHFNLTGLSFYLFLHLKQFLNETVPPSLWHNLSMPIVLLIESQRIIDLKSSYQMLSCFQSCWITAQQMKQADFPLNGHVLSLYQTATCSENLSRLFSQSSMLSQTTRASESNSQLCNVKPLPKRKRISPSENSPAMS